MHPLGVHSHLSYVFHLMIDDDDVFNPAQSKPGHETAWVGKTRMFVASLAGSDLGLLCMEVRNMQRRGLFQRVNRQKTNRTLTAGLLVCSLLVPAMAGTSDKRESNANALVTVENFGQVNDHIYRGGQPKGENFRQLAAIGVKTIVDLRSDSERDAKRLAEAAGLKYINLPMVPKAYPQADAATRFLEIVNNPENGVVYVHCAGGRHRTGSMIAVYRMSVDGWDIDRAYQEMKDYDFYTSMGHGRYLDYVRDYYRDRQAHHKTLDGAGASAVQTAN